MKIKINRFTKILAAAILIMTVYSLIPVAALYLRKDPAPYTNEEAVGRLKDNRGEYFAFIVFGDNHAGLLFNDSSALKLVRGINREDRFRKIPIDFVAVAGDITNRGSLWDYRIYNKIRSLIKWPVISAIGNHDDDDDKGKGLTYFKRYAGKGEFSFADRNSYFILIDNAIGGLSDEQFAHIEEELKKSLLFKHRFIIMHKAPISLYQQAWFRPELSGWSYRFMKLCERYNVDIVFSGHEHMFRAQAFGGVKYVISGGGGMLTQIPESDGGFLHYLVVRVYGDYVDYEVRKVSPPFWEFPAYYLWKEMVYFFRDVIL